MEFFKNIFGRKEKPQSKTAPAPQKPVAQEPVQEEPVVAEKPVPQQAVLTPDTSSSDAIRKALDAACHTLIADSASGAINVGRLLTEIRKQVDDCTCSYRDFDAVLAKAAEQIPSFCLKNADNYAQVTDYVRQLEEAIKARRYTKESVDKYEPRMDTHYYQLKLIYLRGHLHTLQIEMAEKQQWLDNISAMPPEEQAAYTIPRLTCQGYLSSAEMQKKNLNNQIAAYDAGLINATHMVISSGPVDPISLKSIFEAINAQSEQYQQAMVALDQERIMYLAQFAAQMEGQVASTYSHAAAEAQQADQVKEIEKLQDIVAANIGVPTAQPQTQAPQAQAPQAAAPEVKMPMM